MNDQATSLSKRVGLLRPTAVNSILAEVREQQARDRNPVSLMRGEPDLGTPEHIVDAAVTALRSGRTTYPDNRGEAKLREAVSGSLQRNYNLPYDPASEILVTTGATFGIWAALTAILNEGDEVLLPDPIYDAYQSPIRLAGGRPRPVRATIERDRFCIDIDAMTAALTPSSKVLLLNTPWNPVGTVLSRVELEAIADFVVRNNLILISDEIYEAITYEHHRHLPPPTVSSDLRKRCIILNSLSKTYAMTGWRVGYCAAPREIVTAMFLVLQQSSRGPATFIQDAAATALSSSQDCVTEMQRIYATRRAEVLKALQGLPNAHVLPPEGGFFAMVDVRATGIPADVIRKRLLEEAGVVVIHGSAYGEGGEGTLRVSFASGGEKLHDGLQRLRQGLSAL